MMSLQKMSSHSKPETVASDICVELQLFTAGYCSHPEFLTMRGGMLRPVPFPAGFALITHPEHGHMLFDTGYSARFFEETRRFPQLLYRLVTPVTFDEQDSAINQLKQRGIAADDINYVILSHFHADHTAGLRDFPQAQIIYKRAAYEAVKHLDSFAAVKAAYLPKLLPEHFEQCSLHIEDAARCKLPSDFPFSDGYDLFGDGSLIAVDVPGHAAGQIGLFLQTAACPYFLCADAVWSSRAFREQRKPHRAARIIMDNAGDYEQTFQKLCQLHQQYPHIAIIPNHCTEALRQWREGKPL